MYAATTERTVAIAMLVIVVVGWAIYLFVNIRQTKPELGSEIEIAPNRGRLPDDEALEGNRLEQVQAWGVLFLLIIAVALPVYWLREGGRRSGASEGFDNRAASRGEELYVSGFECANCHGADLAGSNTTAVLDIGNQFSDRDSFLVTATYAAPRLDDVFSRFDTEAESWKDSTEVRQILVFGRGVMPAWGLEGGGPANEQQIEDVLAFLWSRQITNPDNLTDEELAEAEARGQTPEEYGIDKGRARDAEEIERALGAEENAGKSEGQVLFEMYCARCHTPRWPSRGEAQLPNNGGTIEVLPGPAGAGRYGPSLNGVALERLFPDIEEQIDFIAGGADDNVSYGDGRLGNYGMPGFENVLTEDQIRAIVEYERSLDPAEQSVVGFEELLTPPEEESEGEDES